MKTVLITHGIPEENLALLKEYKIHYPGLGKAFSKEEIENLLPQTDAIITGGKITDEMMEMAPKLQIISNYGAGYDQVDVAAATKRKIPVTNIPRVTTIPTAEIAIGLLLATARKICELDAKIRKDPKSLFGLSKYTGFSLEGKTLGIVGMGNIGGIVAQFGRLMGMNVIYHNRRELPEDKSHGAVYKTLEELLKTADVVSLHMPLTDQTKNFISKEKLSLLKSSAIMINTARGGVMDYDGLIQMLKEGKLAGAGLDVFPNEPNVPEELFSFENVVLTPHIGTNTLDARNRMTKAACEPVLDIFEGKRPTNVVNTAIYE